MSKKRQKELECKSEIGDWSCVFCVMIPDLAKLEKMRLSNGRIEKIHFDPLSIALRRS